MYKFYEDEEVKRSADELIKKISKAKGDVVSIAVSDLDTLVDEIYQLKNLLHVARRDLAKEKAMSISIMAQSMRIDERI